MEPGELPMPPAPGGFGGDGYGGMPPPPPPGMGGDMGYPPPGAYDAGNGQYGGQ